MKILNVILGMSYNLPKALTSEYQSPSIKIEDFKINPNNLITLLAPREGSEHFNPITKNVL